MADDPRTPPHDEAAERSVIGCTLLASETTLTAVGDLPVDAFYLPNHREAWAAIRAVEARRMPVDIVSVGDELKAAGMDGRFPGGWQAWAVGCANSVTVTHHAASHAGVVRAKAVLRKAIDLAVEIQSAAYGNQPADEVLARFREGFAAIGMDGATGPKLIGDILGDAMDEIEKIQRGERLPGVPTGQKDLDRILRGLKPDRLYILGGRPGDGKTSEAMSIAQHASTNGFPTLVFSREMPTLELVEGVLSRDSGVPAYDIAGAQLQYSDWKELQQSAGRVHGAKLYLDEESATIERIVAVSRQWYAKHVCVRGAGDRPLGLIIVDYLQLVRLAKYKSGMSRENVVAEISRALKELAKELHIPVLVLSQLNRGAEERGGMPIPSDLRESGAIEQDADVIMFVYRDIDPADMAARREPGPAQIGVGKHRGGPTGVAHLYFHTPTMRWTDVADQPEPTGPEPRRHHSQIGDDEP